jgi:predicted nucleic acid-binding protein
MTSATAELAILDTSAYVENVRAGWFEEKLLSLPFLVRVNAVVGVELLRGARSRQPRRFVEQLRRRFPLVVPTGSDWMQSGVVVRALAERHGFEIAKLRKLHFDVLIALGARRIGAHLITCNARDFLAIRELFPFKLLCW